MKIYGMSGSPFVRRTELVLTEKGVDYKLITLSRADGELQSPEHLARNPRGRAPVLEDGFSRSETFDDLKKKCSDIGFDPGTEKFGDCVMRLVE